VTHRRDIDGLRGIAVILVIAYHAQFSLVSSGYVGVDIFFVISGFVITGLLIGQIDNNAFNFTSFYVRRMRRLIPALVVMLAATLSACLFVLGPHDMQILAQSTVAVLLLGANVFFWGRQGYFQAQVPEQPLLHTWSLGIEEQFYLLFPVFLRILMGIQRRFLPIAIIAAMMASCALSIWLTGRHPGAAFYLLPTRAWEFLLGGLIIAVPQRRPLPPATREIIAALGLIGIILSAVGFSRTTPYPGVAALLPTAATAAVIWASGSGTTVVGRILRGQVLVSMGLISYSLYLWHWPVFALARYYFARPLNPVETITALGMVFTLAYASWRYVEQRYRRVQEPAAPVRSMTAIIALGAFVAMAAIVVTAQNGFPRRLPPAALVFDRSGNPATFDNGGCHHGPPELVSEKQLCEIAAPEMPRTKIMLWGDSHANSIADTMAAMGMEHHIAVWQASYSSCPPVLGFDVAHTGSSHHCREFNDTTMDAIRQLGIRRVVLVAFWSNYIPTTASSKLERLADPYGATDDLGTGSESRDIQNLTIGLRRTVDGLEARGIEVWILRQIPSQKGSVPMMLARASILGNNISDVGISLAEHRRTQVRVDTILTRLGGSVRVLDPAAILCKSGWCACSNDRESYYRDSDHLTPSGASLLRPQLAEIFQ
jgi:peptidoglycan/LPS O-acetylase OafA/YrhL